MNKMAARLRPNDPCYCGSGKKYKKCHGPRDFLAGNSAQVDSANQPTPTVTAADQTPKRSVPEAIVRPDYAKDGRPQQAAPKNLVKTPEAILAMRRSCAAARRVLEKTIACVAPGVTTDELDAVAHAAYIEEGGYPSPLGYHHFPKSICTSINEVICHGIPDLRPLEDGDTVNVDVTIYLDGYHGDCSETVCVGKVDDKFVQLVDVTRECLIRAIGVIKPGGKLRDIGKVIEEYVKPFGYGIVENFVGHGIGEVFHMPPQVPHYYDPSKRFRFEPGMTFTIEPMINEGTPNHRVWPDDWTAVTCDLKRSAQFEHTILVTEVGAEILTLPEGAAQPFAF